MSFQTAACTTITLSYWENALAVRHSFLQHHPESEFYILAVDGPAPGFVVPPGVKVFWGKDLPVEGFASYAMRYNAMELVTSLKAPFMRLLLKTHGKVLHLDADILVYDRLDRLFERLDSYAVVLTPHLTSPMPDHYQPGESTFLLAADHNSGFIGFNASEEAGEALLWLEERCREACYNASSTGLCTDQKWYNLLPALFSGVCIERGREFNVAYWNLHERQVTLRDGRWWVNEERPLAFFHFSGCSPLRPDSLTQYASRFNLTNRPELKPLVRSYFDAIKAQGWPGKTRIPYPFDVFSDGRPISAAARHLFAISDFRHSTEDPFDSCGAFSVFCEKWNLFGKQHQAMGANRWNTNHEDPRLGLIRALFRLVLRICGPSIYAAMLNHLQWVTNIRNQRGIFFNEKPLPVPRG